MARADTVTLLSLDRFFRIIGVDSLSGNQLTSSLLPELECRSCVFQNNWMSPAMAGREEYANAIKAAEQDIAAYIGYWPLPTYVADERQPVVRPKDPTLIGVPAGGDWYGYGGYGGGVGVNVRGAAKSVQLRYGYFIAGGRKAKTLISVNEAIAYTDNDGDGYDETATISVNTSVTDPCEIHAYDPAKSGADSWEIRPITVTIAAGVATIVCRREQCVDPALWEAINAGSVGPINADDDANFLSELDVYRVYLDPSTPVQFLRENYACSCNGTGCASCGFSTQYGCLRSRDDRLGTVTYLPATWNTETLQFDAAGYCGWEPDKLRLWYQAGYQSDAVVCPTLQMDPFFERTIAMLALANLQGSVCDCTAVRTFANWAQTDLALNDGTSQMSYAVDKRALACPWGTHRGAVEAFARCNGEGRKLAR